MGTFLLRPAHLRPFRTPVVLAVLAACPVAALHAEPTDAPSGPLHLSYAAYVHGFRAMVIAVDLEEDGERYAVSLHDHTVGLVGAMIDNHVASETTGRFEGLDVHPARYASAGHSRGADRTTEIVDENGVPVVRTLSPVEAKRDKVAPADTVGAVDPLSAIAALFRRYAETGRCDATLRIFDGARLSAVQSWTVGKTEVPGSDASPFSGPAVECDFRSQQIGGFLHDDNFARAHLPEGGRVWLAPDGPGGTPVPIRARFSTVEHGEVTLFLTAVGGAASGAAAKG